ncbi:hypothetical protein D3C77_357840 [compost metagenome]
MLFQHGAHGIALVYPGVHHLEAIRQGEGDVDPITITLVELSLYLQQFLVFTDVEHLVDLVQRVAGEIGQAIAEAGIVMELQQPGHLLFHQPLVAVVDVDVDGGVALQRDQLGRHSARQCLVEDESILLVVHHGAVGGDEVDIQPQGIADAAHIHMVTAGGHHKLDPLIHQTVQGIPGAGGDLVLPVEQGTIEIGHNYLEHHYLGISGTPGQCTPASGVTPFI